MITIIFLFTTIYTITSSTKRLLQQQYQATIYGAFGQICGPLQPDFACSSLAQPLSDEGSGVLECGIEYDCCFCGSIRCGYTGLEQTKPCDTFKAGGDYATYGVKDISVYGEVNAKGAIIDCNGQRACAETDMRGSWIDTVRCSSDESCAYATMDFSQSLGIICGKSSCIGTKVKLNSNRGGVLICGAQNACVNAEIEINGGIFDVKCNGQSSCQNAKILVNNPLNQFRLDCNGDLSCNNLVLTIIIPGPINGGACPISLYEQESIFWKGINCGSNGACSGMKLTVVNNGCQTVIIEDLQCSPGGACTGAVFDLNSGTGFGVEVKNCLCGPSCQDAIGLDVCYNNVALFDCPDISSCANQVHTIHNPANDFVLLCSNTQACQSLHLSIVIFGASQNLIQRFSKFICNANMACKNAIIDIQNTQISSNGNSVVLTINEIQCIADNACDGTTFIVNNNVNINRIVCMGADACNNCMVKQTQSNYQQISIPCIQFSETTTQTPVNLYNPPIIPISIDPSPPIPYTPTTTIVHTIPVQIVPSTTKTPATVASVPVTPIVPPSVPQYIPQYIPATPSEIPPQV